mgnify:CR=1 FL=1
MERYLIEIRGKFYLETDQEPDNIPGDIYARISECFKTDDDIIDIDDDIRSGGHIHNQH